MRVVSGEWMRGFSGCFHCLVFASSRRYNEGHSDLDGQLHGKAGIVWERFLLLRVSM